MPMSVRSRTAVGIPVAALATVLLAVTARAEPASPAAGTALVPKAPASAAATWMASKLTDGSNVKGDVGLTADVVMGLASTDTGGAVQKKVTDWLEANAKAYIESKGGPGTVFTGGLAKLTLVAGIEHRDPKDFGGYDLVKNLTERLEPNGRFTDKNPGGDGSQQFTQALAVLALQRFGGAPPKALDFIAGSRCADGGYPLGFGAAPDSCKSHLDSTGLAVQALLGSGRTAAAKPALNWLEKNQLADGGFPDNSMGSTKGNSNSTALAVQALAAGGRTEAAAKGVAWLRSRQVNCAAPQKDWGAVGFLEPKADGMALRATAQVVPALAGKSLAQVDAGDSAADLEEISCVPGGGTPGGNTGGGGDGGTSGGDGDNGGTDGGGSGGDHGGSGSDGGTDSGGGTGDSGGGGDDATTGGGGDDAPDGGGNAPAPQAGDDSGGSGDAGGSGAQPLGNPGGSLASTGTSSLPLAATAGALLAVGSTAFLVVRRRRTTL
ncbi:prenyltransferase/squalene oxidase repeat-containing protein [Streptomyces spectabilis]|uniref:Terpene cyclase/mutase family protein n=1 Tax=Streptomyces spectabilis TaxID=68270 RepID=A0A516RHH7_STRST|nr:prenyltransferase/squalene oxidase repeat-containing protein [Streptomyces spectabilis]QDQ15106.1 terpene cyclase/mutase family protein [Streptomyces spectabilis]